MVILFDLGETAASPAFQVIDGTGAIVLERSTAGVFELAPGCGIYGVEVPESKLYGNAVLWDSGEASKADRRYAAEAFDVAGAWDANKLIVTDGQMRVRNHDDTADLRVQPLSESNGTRTRGVAT